MLKMITSGESLARKDTLADAKNAKIKRSSWELRSLDLKLLHDFHSICCATLYSQDQTSARTTRMPRRFSVNQSSA